MRTALALALVLTGCHPDVGLDELSVYAVVFEGEQTASGVKGVVGFRNQELSPSDGRCRSLGPRLTATLGSGEPLARTGISCRPGEFDEQFVVPERVGDVDLNIVFDDGEHLSRVVVPGALRSLRMETEQLTLTAEKLSPIRFGLMRGERVFEIYAVFIDELGTERWRGAQDFYGGVRAGPGEPPLTGRVVVSGLVRRQASSCKGFAQCQSQTLFSFSVPARY